MQLHKCIPVSQDLNINRNSQNITVLLIWNTLIVHPKYVWTVELGFHKFRVRAYIPGQYPSGISYLLPLQRPTLFAPALPELLWLPTVWRCPLQTLDCSIVPTCSAWGSATAAKRGPLEQSWAGIQHSRDDEPLGVLMQMRNVRVNGFFFFFFFRSTSRRVSRHYFVV